MAKTRNSKDNMADPNSNPKIPRSDDPVWPHILSAKEGVPVRLAGCDGLVLRVIHPTNPKAPSRNMGVQLFCVPPRGVLSPGSHETEEAYIILRGEGTMTFAQGQRRSVKEGDFIHLPSWCEHGIENTGSCSLEVLICTAPPNP